MVSKFTTSRFLNTPRSRRERDKISGFSISPFHRLIWNSSQRVAMDRGNGSSGTDRSQLNRVGLPSSEKFHGGYRSPNFGRVRIAVGSSTCRASWFSSESLLAELVARLGACDE